MSHDEVVRRYDEDDGRPNGWLLILGVAVLAAGISILGKHTKATDQSLPLPARTSAAPAPAPTTFASHPAGQLLSDLPPSATPSLNPLETVLGQQSGFVIASTICPIVTNHKTTMSVSFLLENITPVSETIVSITPELQPLGPRSTKVTVRQGLCGEATGKPGPPRLQVLESGSGLQVAVAYVLPKLCPTPFPVQVNVTLSIAGQQRAEQLILLSDLTGVKFDTCKAA